MATTPLGIDYPCGGETIDCDTLADYANSTQAAINDTQITASTVSRPPAAFVRRSTAQTTAPGVTATISFNQAMYDTDSMFSLGAPTLVTVNSAGTYLVNLTGSVFSFSTTLTSLRWAIALNGVEVAYYKSDAGTASIGANTPMYVSQLLVSLAAGSTISATTLFTGTGSLGVVSSMAVTRVSTT